MAGLIPLRLPAAAASASTSLPVNNRASVPVFPVNLSPTPGRHARHASDGSAALSGSPVRSFRSTNRSSMLAPASLAVLPYTAAEWKRTMVEVKRHHVAKRFRACSARCVEILDNLKDTSLVEPAHLIYLHFYAANSLEMCARPCLSNGSAKAQLLSQARQHYDKAAALIKDAEHSAVSLTRSSSRASFNPSGGSLHSPSGSISSGTWSTPTTSSPTNSVCSYEDLVSKASEPTPVQRKAKKTVSFQLPKDEQLVFPSEPFIRPDSPTLGFEDAYFAAPILNSPLPEPPKRPVTVLPSAEASVPRRSSLRSSISSQSSFCNFDFDTPRPAQPIHRYCETLSSLKNQLEAHRSHLDAILDKSSGPVRRDEQFAMVVSYQADTLASEELRALDRQARIEKLRRIGWQRKRFDASRYERLCNEALAELS